MFCRDEALKLLAEKLTEQVVNCTIGWVGTGWRYYCKGNPSLFDSGALGLASSIGLGLALGLPERKVVVLDGDGSLLMNLGSLVTAAQQRPTNLVHIVFQNDLYEASGYQPMVNAGKVDFVGLARAVGVEKAFDINTVEELRAKIDSFWGANNMVLAVLKVAKSPPPPYPETSDCLTDKIRLMDAIKPKRLEATSPRKGKPSDESPSALIAHQLKGLGIRFVATLPDIWMKELLGIVSQDADFVNIPMSREDEGVGICAGLYFAGQPSAMMVQNTGLLMSANALKCLALKYKIPVFMLVSNRATIEDPAFYEIPVGQGLIMGHFLDALRIPYLSLSSPADIPRIGEAYRFCQMSQQPVVVLFNKHSLGAEED